MRTLSLITVSTLFVFTSHAQDNWTYVFKGATPDDFYFDFIEETDPEEVFEIKSDGTLVIKGEDQPEGYLQTLDEYENYEIAFEFRWPEGSGKSGIQIHSTSDPAFSVWPESIEIQLEPDSSGDFWLLNHKLEVEEEQMPKKAADRNRRHRFPEKKPSYSEVHLHKKRENPPEEWNRMRIVAEDDTIKVYLNDQLTNEGKEASVTSGYITIQAEESNLEIANFRIREL